MKFSWSCWEEQLDRGLELDSELQLVRGLVWVMLGLQWLLGRCMQLFLDLKLCLDLDLGLLAILCMSWV